MNLLSDQLIFLSDLMHHRNYHYFLPENKNEKDLKELSFISPSFHHIPLSEKHKLF